MSIPKVKRYENGKEIVGQVDTPYEITWEAWQLLTDAEKEKRKWLITDVPSADGFATVENMKLLWTNPSPTVDFASQQITLSSDDYDFYMVKARCVTASSGECYIFEKGYGGRIDSGSFATSARNVDRDITYVDSTHLSFSNATLNGATSNGFIVPLAVYGFKKQIEIRFNALAQNVKATVDYSTEEHPIGTWIDGSTLYEKTIDFGSLPNNTSKSVAHGISNISRIYQIDGIAVETSGNTYKNIPFTVHNTTTGNISMYVDHTNVYIQTSNDQRAYNGYVTLRYTKTA